MCTWRLARSSRNCSFFLGSLGLMTICLVFKSVETAAQSAGRCDLNSDGVVNPQDVQILSNVLQGVQTCPTTSCDINLDGQRNQADLDALAAVSLGGPCPSCAPFTIAPPSRSHGAGSETNSVSVTTSQAGCTWTAASNAVWLTITSATSGTGSGIVNYSVAANPVSTSRTGNLTIAGQIFSANQTGTSNPTPILNSISPNSAAAGSSTVDLTVNGTGFVSDSVVRWNGGPLLTTFLNGNQLRAIIPGTNLAASGIANVSVFSPSPGGGSSTNQTFTITSVCAVASITPTARSHGPGQEQGAINVMTSQPNCGWTAMSNNSWITIVSGSSGIGNGLIEYSLNANPSLGFRSGVISVGGQKFSVNQGGTTAGAQSIVDDWSPTSAVAGGPSFDVTIMGSGFAAGAMHVAWCRPGSGAICDVPLVFSVVDSTRIIATIPAAQIGQPSATGLQVNRLPNGVGGTAGAFAFPVNPAPTIQSLSPSPVPAGAAFTLTVTGANFVSGFHGFWFPTVAITTVQWNGSPLLTTFVSPTELTAAVPASLVAQPGTATITLSTLGVTSLPVSVSISSPPISTPQITSISPSVIGSPPLPPTYPTNSFTLTVDGTNFTPNAVIEWRGAPLPTSYVSPNKLTATITLAEGPVGVIPVTVALQGLRSNPVTFYGMQVTNFSPSSIVAGEPTFTLLIRGVGFPPGSVAAWNGTTLISTRLNPNEISAIVPSSLVSTAGNARVTSVSQGVSSHFTFFPVAPRLNEIIPSSVRAGSGGFTITANGSGFTSGSVVYWNGTPLETTFVSATQLTALVPASMVATAGMAAITVASGGVTSSGVSVTVTSNLTINTTSPLPIGVVGVAYSQNLTATGGTPPYMWSLTSGALPTGLTLSSAGSITGTPSVFGTSTFTIRATDSALAAATQAYSLTIRSGLTISTTSLPSGTVGVAYSRTLAATGGSAPYTWSLASGNLPGGLALSSSGAIIGTPTTSGTSTFSVRVTDSVSTSTTENLSLTISSGVTITTTSPLPPAAVGIPYSQTLAAAGGSPPYTWSLMSGSLPAGLIFSSGSTITGTPTGPGTASFAVRVTDSASISATQTFSLTVNASLLISNASPLANGRVGIPYSQTFTTAGGIPPYSWSVSGAAPSGLTLGSTSGILAGTPTSTGNSTFTVVVIDGSQAQAQKAFSITIDPQLSVPSMTIMVPSETAAPASQPRIGTVSSAPYANEITGRMELSFASNADVASDDPAIQFSSGGRAVDFRIPANGTSASFPGNLSEIPLAAGTVAGTITLNVTRLQVNGQDVNPRPPSKTLSVQRTRPTIVNLSVGARGTSSFELVIDGFSTIRSLTEVRVTFRERGGTRETNAVIPATDAFGTWYRSDASKQFGSQFRLTIPFTVQGDIGLIGFATLTIRNTEGDSDPRSVNF